MRSLPAACAGGRLQAGLVRVLPALEGDYRPVWCECCARLAARVLTRSGIPRVRCSTTAASACESASGTASGSSTSIRVPCRPAARDRRPLARERRPLARDRRPLARDRRPAARIRRRCPDSSSRSAAARTASASASGPRRPAVAPPGGGRGGRRAAGRARSSRGGPQTRPASQSSGRRRGRSRRQSAAQTDRRTFDTHRQFVQFSVHQRLGLLAGVVRLLNLAVIKNFHFVQYRVDVLW